MVIAIVTFHLPRPATAAQMAEIFRSTAPKYLGIAGLGAKNYWINENGTRAGGIYFWATRADAERCYTAEWKQAVAAKYECAPEIEYLLCPVSVDNSSGVIHARQIP